MFNHQQVRNQRRQWNKGDGRLKLIVLRNKVAARLPGSSGSQVRGCSHVPGPRVQAACVGAHGAGMCARGRGGGGVLIQATEPGRHTHACMVRRAQPVASSHNALQDEMELEHTQQAGWVAARASISTSGSSTPSASSGGGGRQRTGPHAASGHGHGSSGGSGEWGGGAARMAALGGGGSDVLKTR